MKVVSLNTKEVYGMDIQKSGENNLPCPECASDHPKSAHKKCFSFNLQKGAGLCHRCDAKFVKFEPHQKKQESVVPQWSDKTQLSEKHLKWFQSRGISNDALNLTRVSSTTEYMPQFNKEVDVVCFPFIRNGKVVNVKYRGPQKSFKLTKGAELTFWNMDSIKENPNVIICEGEIDGLSFITCGLKFVVSVPNGASKNLSYLDNCFQVFDDKKEIILAVDNDPKGIALRDELARRLGPEKCKIVDFKDCKDANEYLQKYGGMELFNVVKSAKIYPVEGVFSPIDFKDKIYNLYQHGLRPGLSLGMPEIDKYITWESGRLAIITGIPSHGKSEFLDFVLVRLNLLYRWKTAYFSPENHPLEYHYAKLAEKFVGKEFSANKVTPEEYESLLGYLSENFFFIAPEDNYSVESIISKAKFLVKSRGIKTFVIDPYNRLEHQHPRGVTETQYISQFLDQLTNFARRNNVLVYLVAHRIKMQKGVDGCYEVPNLYSISGSSNFYNKCDYGVCVYREANENGLTNNVQIHIQKVKFKHMGKTGKVDLVYNYHNGRYEVESPNGINGWDNSDWLQNYVSIII